jgi:hypothetical protein
MKVIKVIVDEIPEHCYHCCLKLHSSQRCGIMDGRLIEQQYVVDRTRPDWCPLAPLTREAVYEIYDKWYDSEFVFCTDNKWNTTRGS